MSFLGRLVVSLSLILVTLEVRAQIIWLPYYECPASECDAGCGPPAIPNGCESFWSNCYRRDGFTANDPTWFTNEYDGEAIVCNNCVPCCDLPSPCTGCCCTPTPPISCGNATITLAPFKAESINSRLAIPSASLVRSVLLSRLGWDPYNPPQPCTQSCPTSAYACVITTTTPKLSATIGSTAMYHGWKKDVIFSPSGCAPDRKFLCGIEYSIITAAFISCPGRCEVLDQWCSPLCGY
jgi:hypothetical protein